LDFNQEQYDNALHTKRTKLAHEDLSEILIAGGIAKDSASRLALDALSRLVDKGGASKAKTDKNGRVNMPALIWLSPAQLQSAATAILENREAIEKAIEAAEKGDKKLAKEADSVLKKTLEPVGKAIRDAGISDAGDIALFGRMVANDPSLNVEGAAMFAHALSTHKVSNEVDFYSAVDDGKQQDGDDNADENDEAGAGMIGTLEFTSATYYRYAAINLEILFDAAHLKKIDDSDERKKLVKNFIYALLTAVPGARKNSMNAATLPFEVLGIFKSKGQPIQLINAFESPVHANGKGLAVTSLEALKSELAKLKTTWAIKQEESWLTEIGIEAFLEKLTSHVE
jgi:CRISPR system Cascade subunit CasC